MASSKTVLKTIRIKNETAAYFKDKPLNRYVDGLCESMERGEIEGEADGIKIKGGVGSVYTEIDECVLQDMRVMASFSGVTLNKYLQMLCDAMNEGRVIYEDGEFRAESEIDLSKFKEACDGRGLKYQKMIDKCAQMIWGM